MCLNVKKKRNEYFTLFIFLIYKKNKDINVISHKKSKFF